MIQAKAIGILRLKSKNWALAVADEVIKKWRADVKKYKRPRRSPAPPPAERQQFPTPRDVDPPFPFVAGVIEGGVAEHAPSEPGCAWKEPSWDRKTGPPPSIEQTSHIWRLNRLHALAFHIIATAFLRYGETSDEGAPKLEAEKQLLVILNGEAGVGKSQVLRCFMWFANQHGRAEQLVHWYLIPYFGLRTTAHDARACVRIGYIIPGVIKDYAHANAHANAHACVRCC